MSPIGKDSKAKINDRVIDNTESYTTLKIHSEMSSGHNVWLPGPTGIVPKDTDPPRYEFKQLSEHAVTFDHVEDKKYTDKAGDITLKYTHRFWGELFGGLMLIADFAISGALEAVTFVLKIISLVLLGILIRISDYLVKPILVFVYNAFVIPSLNLTATLVSAVVQIINPVLDLFQRGAEIAAIVLRSFRLCEFHKHKTVLKEHKETESV